MADTQLPSQDMLKQIVKEALDELLNEKLKSIDFGLWLETNLRSARFLLDNNMPLNKRHTHGSLRDEGISRMPAQGMVMEFGVWKGHWINHIAQKTPRPVYGFDSFEGLPEDWSIHNKDYFALDALPVVRDNVTLVKGWFSQSLPGFLATHPEKVAYIHLDCDLYSSTMDVLRALYQHNRFQEGTVIVLDDFMMQIGFETEEHKAFFDFIRFSGYEFEYIGYAYEVPSCSAGIILRNVK